MIHADFLIPVLFVRLVLIIVIWCPALLGARYNDINSYLNSFPTGDDFCRLPTTFANSLDPDQARQTIWPHLDPNCLTL